MMMLEAANSFYPPPASDRSLPPWSRSRLAHARERDRAMDRCCWGVRFRRALVFAGEAEL